VKTEAKRLLSTSAFSMLVVIRSPVLFPREDNLFFSLPLLANIAVQTLIIMLNGQDLFLSTRTCNQLFARQI